MSDQPQDTGAMPSIEAWWWEANGTGTASCPKCHNPDVCPWHAARLDDLEALMQQRERQVELALLSGLAKKADKEYSRTEIDNWIFSLGSLAHEELLERQQTEAMKGGGDAK